MDGAGVSIVISIFNIRCRTFIGFGDLVKPSIIGLSMMLRTVRPSEIRSDGGDVIIVHIAVAGDVAGAVRRRNTTGHSNIGGNRSQIRTVHIVVIIGICIAGRYGRRPRPSVAQVVTAGRRPEEQVFGGVENRIDETAHTKGLHGDFKIAVAVQIPRRRCGRRPLAVSVGAMFTKEAILKKMVM